MCAGTWHCGLDVQSVLGKHAVNKLHLRAELLDKDNAEKAAMAYLFCCAGRITWCPESKGPILI